MEAKNNQIPKSHMLVIVLLTIAIITTLTLSLITLWQ